FALTLPDTERGTSYGKPAVKIVSNGRAFLFPSHEADTSFGVAIDLDAIEILKETDPDTFWQSPHYVGWEGELIRYDSSDEDRARVLGLCRPRQQRRGSGSGELPRSRASPAFLFRHRRRREGRLHALPSMRPAIERAGRPQDCIHL